MFSSFKLLCGFSDKNDVYYVGTDRTVIVFREMRLLKTIETKTGVSYVQVSHEATAKF